MVKKWFREASERPIGPEESKEKRKERSWAALWCSEGPRKKIRRLISKSDQNPLRITMDSDPWSSPEKKVEKRHAKQNCLIWRIISMADQDHL